MGPIKSLGQGVGVLVGLGQEAHAHNKAKKEAARMDGGVDKSEPGPRGDDPPPYTDQEPGHQVSKGGVEIASGLEGQERSLQHLGQLPAPVIIPQKRPTAKARGFLDAYAPALADCGVDQETFLDFIDGFDASKQNGAFNVLNLAVAIGAISNMAVFGPSLTIHLAAMAVHLSIETGKQLYVNKKTNTYLDKWNETYLKPHGLFAMIMTYEPNSSETGKLMDLETQTSEAATSTGSWTQKFHIASGTATETQIPEVCPLILLEKRSQGEGNSFKRAAAFTADYFDRRAQASCAAKNPDSKLNVVDHQFAGRYADPTTFEHSGLIGIVTGGAVDPCKRGWEEEEEEGLAKERRAAAGDESKKHRKDKHKDKKNDKQGGLIHKMRQRLSEGVLYLLIVNMPGASEMDDAARYLREVEAQK